ncbi:hypothetical protein HK101_006544 [Irineochytrium annulatum]|nr:hypothetical protein HK101_006544 [Irineochytrium annulatum]
MVYLAVLDATQDGQLYVVTPAQAGSANPSIPINLDTADMTFFDKYGLSCSDLPRFAGGLDANGYYANIFYDNAMQKAYIDTTDAVADTDTTTPRLAIFSIQPFARKSLLVDDLCISDPLLCMFQDKVDIMEYLIFQTPTRKSNVTAFNDETDGDGWGEMNDVVRLHSRGRHRNKRWRGTKVSSPRTAKFTFLGTLANKFAKFDLTSSKGLQAVQSFVNTKDCRGNAMAPQIPLMPFSNKGEKTIICVRDNDDAIGAYFVSVYDKSLLTPDVSTDPSVPDFMFTLYCNEADGAAAGFFFDQADLLRFFKKDVFVCQGGLPCWQDGWKKALDDQNIDRPMSLTALTNKIGGGFDPLICKNAKDDNARQLFEDLVVNARSSASSQSASPPSKGIKHVVQSKGRIQQTVRITRGSVKYLLTAGTTRKLLP